MDEELNIIEKNKINNINALREKGINPFSNKFVKENIIEDILSEYNDASKEFLEENNIHIKTSGRILIIRSFGKASFFRLRDGYGEIQCYIQKGSINDEDFELFDKFLDAGDICGVTGHLFRTKTNELTIKAESIKLLSKSVLPLPEKWHGLKDIEVRFRKRYIDLIANKDVRDIFIKRADIISYIRAFLNNDRFLEVETPIMHANPGGATARPFKTHHNALDLELYMRVAPELYLKRLIVGGFDRVYEIGRNFRNEGISVKHNPEFTMLEFYMAYSNYEDMMKFVEKMISGLVEKICGKLEINYIGTDINFAPPFKKIKLQDSLYEVAGFSTEDIDSSDKIIKILQNLNLSIDNNMNYGELLTILFEETVESKLINPTFVTDYPVESSPLARRNDIDPKVVDRFEFFVAGRELANAFSELNDPFDQEERFKAQVDIKLKEGLPAEIDEDYIEALKYGLPPAAGCGIGIDRLVMLLTNSYSIRDVILFPLLKPVK
ncbi:MAG: lysine--tRNA ligase [Candidatus Acididesulfobacter diazotrophicus]|jgi:lysyl-tRNA synthetase class 2|uniref:Lysine--tRNA ligase n=1 Tax=Candidatus Acididesulfobacter diazotrophicus TaxID=2597226 RepID=A0A519BMD8_9DELT|nr:MAG: lysine--tRNA ligase [Candidatus Acididesulfobacter diazotrophicus]